MRCRVPRIAVNDPEAEVKHVNASYGTEYLAYQTRYGNIHDRYGDTNEADGDLLGALEDEPINDPEVEWKLLNATFDTDYLAYRVRYDNIPLTAKNRVREGDKLQIVWYDMRRPDGIGRAIVDQAVIEGLRAGGEIEDIVEEAVVETAMMYGIDIERIDKQQVDEVITFCGQARARVGQCCWWVWAWQPGPVMGLSAERGLPLRASGGGA